MPELDYDPDAGSVGYLTWDEWDRLTRSWTTALKHLPWWWVAGHVRGGDAEELRVRSSERPLGLPATWLAAHEITRLMQELNWWPELDQAVRTQDGADLALLLIREVETAAARWPMSDRSHRVRYFRCQACQQLTLKYLPPTEKAPDDAPLVEVQVRSSDGSLRVKGDLTARPVLWNGRTMYVPEVMPASARLVTVADVAVRCTDKKCGAVMDHSMFEIAVKVIEQEWELKRAERGLDSGKRSPRIRGQIDWDGVPVGSAEPSGDNAPRASAVPVAS